MHLGHLLILQILLDTCDGLRMKLSGVTQEGMKAARRKIGFTRLSLAGRLTLLIVLLLSIGASIAWIGIQGALTLSGGQKSLIEREFAQVQRLSNLGRMIQAQRRFEKDLLLYIGFPAQVDENVRKWREANEASAKALSEFRRTAAAEVDIKLLDEAERHLSAYRSGLLSLQQMIATGSVKDTAIATGVADTFATRASMAEAAIGRITEDKSAVAERRSRQAQESVELIIKQMALALTLALVLGSIAAWWIAKSITASVHSAIRVTERVASGDLGASIPSADSMEIARLLAALGEMQTALTVLVSEVREAAELIQSTAHEFAKGNADLSRRTEMQASSAEETAATVEQLAAQLQLSAGASAEVARLAAAAANVAIRGGKLIEDVVRTMREIEVSSSRISEIVSVIDGIAFQTKLLALNAAVEAAHAGEHGRGFNVVASEVRKLAANSAQAAKEIKQIVHASMVRVAEGGRLVSQAGLTMEEIISHVEKVAALIRDVTSAAEEQSAGMGQMNVAISQIQTMTQQNSAMVEESAAASMTLRDQALVLVDAVSKFKVLGPDIEEVKPDRRIMNRRTGLVSVSMPINRNRVTSTSRTS